MARTYVSPALLLLATALLVSVGCGAARTAPDVPDGGCERFVLDTDGGTLNGVPPTASFEEVKARLSCSSGDTEEGSPFNRGGGVFYLDHDFFFYTYADFLEVRARFRGAVRPPLLARDRADVEDLLGPPASRIDDGAVLAWDRPYGCLVLLFSGDRVDEIRVHATGCVATKMQY